MDLVSVNNEKTKDYFEYLYDEAFPEYEQVEIQKLYKLANKELIDINLIAHDDQYTGLAVVFLNDDINLLSYFAIDPEYRGEGLGSKSLDVLLNSYDDLMIEIESTKEQNASDIKTRKKRKNFYIKNGFYNMNEDINYFGTDMELMVTNEDASIYDYFNTYENIFEKSYIKENIILIN